MPGQPFATILARSDPFDVAQASERYIRTLGAQEIRDLISAARPRLNAFYREQFLPLIEETSGDRLQRGFTHALRTNLRAIPLFGAAFCEGVCGHLPSDRAVAMTDEFGRTHRPRPMAYLAIAFALVIAGAAAEHAVSVSSARAAAPAPATLPPLAYVPIVRDQAHPPAHRLKRRPPPTPAPQPVPALLSTPPPAVAAVAVAAPVERNRSPRPPVARGTLTIRVTPAPATPTPVPTPVDVSDMPEAYSDATALPSSEPPPTPAPAPNRLLIATPTPVPRHYSWFHRTIMHVDPFKPHPHSTP